MIENDIHRFRAVFIDSHGETAVEYKTCLILDEDDLKHEISVFREFIETRYRGKDIKITNKTLLDDEN